MPYTEFVTLAHGAAAARVASPEKVASIRPNGTGLAVGQSSGSNISLPLRRTPSSWLGGPLPGPPSSTRSPRPSTAYLAYILVTRLIMGVRRREFRNVPHRTCATGRAPSH